MWEMYDWIAIVQEEYIGKLMTPNLAVSESFVCPISKSLNGSISQIYLLKEDIKLTFKFWRWLPSPRIVWLPQFVS